jgi:hypothetical protein
VSANPLAMLHEYVRSDEEVAEDVTGDIPVSKAPTMTPIADAIGPQATYRESAALRSFPGLKT